MLLYCLSNRPVIAVLYLYFASLQITAAKFDGWGEGKRDSQSDTYWENRPRGNSFGVPGFNETYDYVIVGGGTAGNTLAARLAEDPRGFSVAIIEAGGFYEFENGNLTEVPGYNGWSIHLDETRPSLVEWDIETTPQVGYNGRTIHYPQGRTLGGTSAINSLGYQRGTIGFHELWVEATGDEAWSWDNTLPFYKKSCKFTPPKMENIGQEFDIPYDEKVFSLEGGPLRVSYGNYRGEYVNAVARSFERIGLKKVDGLNSGELLGYGAVTLNIDPETQTRSTSETSFLQAAMAKTSLKVYPHTLAKKILFNKEKRATGVLAATMGQIDYEFVVSARREVIVSAGVFRSPQLLMVSGVGPRKTLHQFDIPVISELEGVGQNLWDQPYYRLTYKVNATTLTQMENPEYLHQAVESYIKSRKGPLATNNAGEVIGWEKLPEPYRSKLNTDTLSHLTTFPPDFPEIELLPLGIGVPPASHVPSPTNNYMTFAVGILTPRSRGNVTITSTDTRLQPLVNPNFLHDPVDVDLAIQAVLRAREVRFYFKLQDSSEILISKYTFIHPMWAEKTGIILKEEEPGLEVQTEEQIRSWLREAGALVAHGMSTCSMGKITDSRAVLNSEARVFGVEGLRVVDASSSPLLGPGHPIATVYMMAEKVANLILNDAGVRTDNKKTGNIEAKYNKHSEL